MLKSLRAMMQMAQKLKKPATQKGSKEVEKMADSTGKNIQGILEVTKLAEKLIEATGMLQLFTGIFQVFLGQLGIMGKEIILPWIPHMQALVGFMQEFNIVFKVSGQFFSSLTLFMGEELGSSFEILILLLKTFGLVFIELGSTTEETGLYTLSLNNNVKILYGTTLSLTNILPDHVINMKKETPSSTSGIEGLSLTSLWGSGLITGFSFGFSIFGGEKKSQTRLEKVVSTVAQTGKPLVWTALEGIAGALGYQEGGTIQLPPSKRGTTELTKKTDTVGMREGYLSSILDELQVSRKELMMESKFQKRRRF